MTYTIRPAQRRDLDGLSALALAQAAARRVVDPRLPASPQIIPFLSQAETLDDVLSQRHHVTLVARRQDTVIGGINVHRVEQNDRDPFAAYYPRSFTSIGLLAAHGDAPATMTVDLLTSARAQAARWKTPALLIHNATSDCALRDTLSAFGFRMFYHYALRSAGASSAPCARAVSAERGGRPAAQDIDLRTPVPGPGNTPAKSAGQVEPAGAAHTRFSASAHTSPTAPSSRQPDVDGLMVRHAAAADLAAVVRLGIDSVHYHASLEPAMHVPRGEDGKMRRRFEAILRERKQSALFVAVLDGRVVGFYSLYLQSIDETWTPPLFAPGRYGLLAEVAVAEGLRGRGIGRRLFAAVDQWFRERGAHRLWLIYLPRNPLSSRFWPALGFEPVWDVMVAGE
jgi:GNAT superfamily N-acetyltransferase